MKKNEKINEIRRRAREYAKTGEHRNWLSIELQITSEGFPEAKQVLDNHLTRDELNSVCNTATSSEEFERRERFELWLKELVWAVSPVLKQEMPEVKLSILDETLFVAGPNYSVEVRRKFGNGELEATNVIDTADGRTLTFSLPNRVTDFKFEEITGEHAVKLIIGLARNGSSIVRSSMVSSLRR